MQIPSIEFIRTLMEWENTTHFPEDMLEVARGSALVEVSAVEREEGTVLGIEEGSELEKGIAFLTASRAMLYMARKAEHDLEGAPLGCQRSSLALTMATLQEKSNILELQALHTLGDLVVDPYKFKQKGSVCPKCEINANVRANESDLNLVKGWLKCDTCETEWNGKEWEAK